LGKLKKETVSINKSQVLAKITPVIEKVAEQLGLVLLEVDFIKQAGIWYVRIFIYSHDHSISHKDCEEMTKGLNDYLEQLIPVQYYLEVSGHGADRKLKSPKEYLIFKGKKVDVKLRKPVDNMKTFSARLIDYDPQTGLKFALLSSDNVIIIGEENISSVRLKAEFKI